MLPLIILLVCFGAEIDRRMFLGGAMLNSWIAAVGEQWALMATAPLGVRLGYLGRTVLRS